MMEEQEKKTIQFLEKAEAWTEYELADLCLGLMPDSRRADNEERNEVLEIIHRAAEGGKLPRKTNSLQPFNLHQYRTSTYYPRSEATRWAADNFPETFLFKDAAGGKHKAPGKRERDTLLTIIAAFCNDEGMNLKERGLAAKIAQMTQKLGASVDEDTIRKVLAQIPAAVGSRMK